MKSSIAAESQALTLLDKLIAFPTLSRTPNVDLIDYVAQIFANAGIEHTIIPSADRQNASLFAQIGPKAPGGILLSGHTDVVPTEGQDWSSPAFSMMERGGHFYGRGTADMKGFVACAISALLAAKDKPLKRPLSLALSYDEEIGCVGVSDLIDWLKPRDLAPEVCVVGEPTEMRIATGHKGKLTAKAVFNGQAVHSSLAPMGVNALHLGAEFINQLRTFQISLAETGQKDAGFEVPYSTIHAGVFKGGTALNIVADHAELIFEIRHLADESPEEILRKIQLLGQEIAENFSLENANAPVDIETLNAYPGLDTVHGSEAVKLLTPLLEDHETKKVSFGTEGGRYASELGYPTVVCGPGSMDQGHKPDEFISKDQIWQCVHFLDRLSDRMCSQV